jgi:hypothetical protein
MNKGHAIRRLEEFTFRSRLARLRGLLSLALALATAVLCAGIAEIQAQRAWSKGSFELPMEAKWNNEKLAPGEYRFTVVTVVGQKWGVRVEREGEEKLFVANTKQLVRTRKLFPRIVLHVGPGDEAEVVDMEIPAYGYVLKFDCQHKKEKDEAEPRRKIVMLKFD